MEREPRHRQSDEELINQALSAAIEGHEVIPDAAARMIASQLHGGQTSALYSLASSGAIDGERLAHELGAIFFDDDIEPDVLAWVLALRDYLTARQSHEPVKGWHKLWIEGGEH